MKVEKCVFALLRRFFSFFTAASFLFFFCAILFQFTSEMFSKVGETEEQNDRHNVLRFYSFSLDNIKLSKIENPKSTVILNFLPFDVDFLGITYHV